MNKCEWCGKKKAKWRFCDKHCSNKWRYENMPEIHEKMIKNAAKVCKGHTFEEISPNKAEKRKNEISIRFSGKGNPNYGAKYTHGFGDNPRLGTLESQYGIKKAKDIKLKLSIANSGKNNPMYGKPPSIKAGKGWTGRYKGHFFRSLMELAYLKYLIDNSINFETGELSKHGIKYKVNKKDRTYYPDFYLIDEDLYIEIKNSKMLNIKEIKVKTNAAKKKFGKKFKILTENDFEQVTFDDLFLMKENKDLELTDRFNKKLEEIKSAK